MIFLLSAAIHDSRLLFYLLLGEVLLVMILMMVYSYIAWRGDPNKRNGGEENGAPIAQADNAATLRAMRVISVVLILGLAVVVTLWIRL